MLWQNRYSIYVETNTILVWASHYSYVCEIVMCMFQTCLPCQPTNLSVEIFFCTTKAKRHMQWSALGVSYTGFV